MKQLTKKGLKLNFHYLFMLGKQKLLCNITVMLQQNHYVLTVGNISERYNFSHLPLGRKFRNYADILITIEEEDVFIQEKLIPISTDIFKNKTWTNSGESEEMALAVDTLAGKTKPKTIDESKTMVDQAI